MPKRPRSQTKDGPNNQIWSNLNKIMKVLYYNIQNKINICETTLTEIVNKQVSGEKWRLFLTEEFQLIHVGGMREIQKPLE